MRSDFIIDQIHAGTIQPRTHVVIPALLAQLPLPSRLHQDILERFFRGETIGDTQTLTVLWEEIEALPLAKQGSGRLLVGLCHADKAIDGYDAEWVIEWAHAEGLPLDGIARAFGVQNGVAVVAAFYPRRTIASDAVTQPPPAAPAPSALFP